MIPQPLERTITLTDMVAYAGATWDWHRLHYDNDFVASKGLPGPVVDGQMLGALMVEQILHALKPSARPVALSIRYKAMMFAGETVKISCVEEPSESGLRTFAQRAEVGDRLVAEGTIKVRDA